VHAVADASGNPYWWSTLAIDCSPLEAGQADVMLDRHDRPIANFRDTECSPREQN